MDFEKKAKRLDERGIPSAPEERSKMGGERG